MDELETSLDRAGRTHRALLSFRACLLTLPVQMTPRKRVAKGAEILSRLSLFILAQCLVSSLSKTDRLVPSKGG